MDIGKLLSNSSDDVSYIDKFIGDEVCTQLAERLRDNSSKRRLILRGNCIGPSGAHALSQMLLSNKSIEYISLEWNEISSSGVLFLAASLGRNNSLIALDLRNNGVKDDCTIALSKAVEENTQLKTLDLRWNQISDIGALNFEQPLINRPTKLNIQLSGNLLTDKVLAHIENISPKPIIIEEPIILPPVIEKSPPHEEIPKPIPIPQPDYSILHNEIALLKKHITERDILNEDLQRQLTNSAINITEIEQSLHHYKNLLEQSNEHLKIIKTRYSDQCNELNNLKQRFELERNEITEEVKRILNEKESEFNMVSKERDLLQDRLRKAEGDISRLTNTASMTEELHRNQISALQTELSSTVTRLNELESQHSRALLESDALKSALDRAICRGNSLQTELNQSREDTHNILLEQTTKSEAEASRLTQEIEAKSRMHNEHVEKLQNELEQSKSQYRVLQSELVTMQMDLPINVKAAVNSVREEERMKYDSMMAELRGRIEDLMKIRYALEEKYEQLTADSQNAKEDQEVVLMDVRMQLEETLKLLESTRLSERDAKDMLNASIRDHASASSQLRQLKEKLTSLSEEEKHWRRECKTAVETTRAAENKILSLSAELDLVREKRRSDFTECRLRISRAVQDQFEQLLTMRFEEDSSSPSDRGRDGDGDINIAVNTNQKSRMKNDVLELGEEDRYSECDNANDNDSASIGDRDNGSDENGSDRLSDE